MEPDPREHSPKDPHDVLTEDSDDALADLEKEFAARKKRILEEKAKKRERNVPQVPRSPSPSREKPDYEASYFNITKPKAKSAEVSDSVLEKRKWSNPFSTQFASRLHEARVKGTHAVDLNERIFEFENLPQPKMLPVDETQNVDFVSGELLSCRYLNETDLKEVLSVNIKVLRVTKLLAKVNPPKFEEPQYTNWCFTGIVLHKSEPKTTVNHKKYMALRIGNFVHSVDVYLFGDAFTRFWKIRCGDVVLMLNPKVKKYGSGFNLSVSEDLNSIIEIGKSKNYGHCSAKNKQGERCKYVVDISKNQLCSFHEESKFKPRSRMELQGSVKPKAPIDKSGSSGRLYMNNSGYHAQVAHSAEAGFSEKDVVYAGGEQFDQTKYDRPIKENEGSKLRKRKANDKLRTRLMEDAAHGRLNELEKLGLVAPETGNSAERQVKLQKLSSQAFQSKFLSGLGYDPTQENFKNSQKLQPGSSMQELRQIIKQKKVSLKASKDEHMKKQARRKRALGIMDKHGEEEKSRSLEPIKLADKRWISRGGETVTTCENPSAQVDEDDSDLEIDFACEADRENYLHAVTTVSRHGVRGVHSESL